MELRKRKKCGRSVAARIAFIASVGCLLFIFSFFTVNKNLSPALAAFAAARAEAAGTQALNDAIITVLQDDVNNSNLLSIHQATDISMLQADTRKMNLLASNCVAQAYSNLEAICEEGIHVPFGTVSGISLLAGMGPDLTVKFRQDGSIQSNFRSEFKSAGINQTLYRVYFSVTATMRIVLPNINDTVTVRAEMPITEVLLAGSVPQAYTDVANEEDMLNLIPTQNP